MYVIRFSEKAQEDLQMLQRHKPQAIKKVRKLLQEIAEHPREGTGKVEQLKYFKNETWSRRISSKHRLVYEIHDEQIYVLVISSYGHYDDK